MMLVRSSLQVGLHNMQQTLCQKLIFFYFQSVGIFSLVLELPQPHFGRRFWAKLSSIPDTDQDNRHNPLFQRINLRRRKTTHDRGVKVKAFRL
jgi:hypothetical protein